MSARSRVLAALWIVIVCALPVSASLAADDELLPFVISYDAPDNATNVSAWLAAPVGKHGFVRADKGKLVTDAGPIRFWATNLCFDACFPEKKQAERVAARLARLGVNCVRTHHMDSHSIFQGSPNKLTLSAEQLDKTVPLLRHGEMNLTEPARNDFVDFLWDTEAKYWGGMYRFLKDELKVKPLVSGTQMGYSPAHIQSRLDSILWTSPATAAPRSRSLKLTAKRSLPSAPSTRAFGTRWRFAKCPGILLRLPAEQRLL